MKRCIRCEQDKPITEFFADARTADGLDKRCKACKNLSREQIRVNRRADTLKLLGSRCAHCGERDVRVLEVDHLNGGGHAERRAGVKHGSNTFFDMIAANPERYQLLCANCHRIKTWEDQDRQRGRPRVVAQTRQEREAWRAAYFSSDEQSRRGKLSAIARGAPDGLCTKCRAAPRSKSHSWCNACHYEPQRRRIAARNAAADTG